MSWKKKTGKFWSNLVVSLWSIAKNQSLKILQGKAKIIKWTLEDIIFHCNWIIHINAYRRIKDKWNKGIWNEKKESLRWDKNSLSSAFWIFLVKKKRIDFNQHILVFWYQYNISCRWPVGNFFLKFCPVVWQWISHLVFLRSLFALGLSLFQTASGVPRSLSHR